MSGVAVGILNERNERRAIRIVLERLHRRLFIHTVLLEVDHSIKLFIAAALMAHGDATRRVAAGMRLQSLHESLKRPRAFGERTVVRRDHVAPRSACWVERLHYLVLVQIYFLPLFNSDDRFAVSFLAALDATAGLFHFARAIQNIHARSHLPYRAHGWLSLPPASSPWILP